MYIIYLFISCFSIIMSKNLYRRIINPISIYMAIWLISISLYSSNLIHYNKMASKTWLVLIFSSLLFSISSIFFVLLYNNKRREQNIYNKFRLERKLRFLIYFFSFFSLLTIVPKFLFVIKNYGINVFINIYDVYQDSIYNVMEFESFFNFSSFNFLGAFFSSIYIQKIGFNKITLLPLILAILTQFSSGSRGGFLAILLIYASSLILMRNVNYSLKNIKKLKKLFIFSVLILLIITYYRNTDKQLEMPYASNLLLKMSLGNKFLYSLIFYFSSPIAVLNDYVMNPIHSFFGASTFRVFYMLLGGSKYQINFIGEYVRFVPMPSNVMTYLGELIYDFGFSGMYFVIVILASLFSYSFMKLDREDSMIWQPIYVVSFCLVGMSFFAWIMRPVFYWLILIVGLPTTYYLEKTTKVRKDE